MWAATLQVLKVVLGALAGALVTHLENRRKAAEAVRLGRLEEKIDAEAANARVRLAVRELELRLMDDPEYALRMRERFTRLAGS